jgi:hypothetical protein
LAFQIFVDDELVAKQKNIEKTSTESIVQTTGRLLKLSKKTKL